MTVELSNVKTRIIHLRQRKTLHKQKMAENNSKLLLSGKFDFDPEEILDKLLLFSLKKISKDRIFDSIKKYQTKTISTILNIEKERTHLG